MQKREFHPMELALPAVFLILVYVALYASFTPFTGPVRNARQTFERAQLLKRRGNFSQALTYIQRLTREFPTNHVYWAQEADLHHRLGRPLDEAHALEQILVYSSVPDEACPRLGQAYDMAGFKDRMLDAHRRCLKLEPNNADFHFFLGHAEERDGDLDSAFREYQACLGRAPNYLDCSTGLARVHLRRGEPKTALEILTSETTRGRAESDADALLARALSRRRMGQVHLAKFDLEKAVHLSPDYQELREQLDSLQAALVAPAAVNARLPASGETDVEWLNKELKRLSRVE